MMNLDSERYMAYCASDSILEIGAI